jgi:hypothetical protein
MKRTTRTDKQHQNTPPSRVRITPQSLLRGEYVPLGKACELLGGIDTRTLRGWINELSIKTFAHPTDGRISLLRSTDVAKLAKISDRPVLLPATTRTRQSSRAALERQLAELRQERERTIADYERQLAELRKQHERELEELRGRIRELEHPGSP